MKSEISRENDSLRGRRLEALGIVFAFAMLLSVLYVGAIAGSHFLLGRFVSASRDVVWMAPLSSLFFCLVGLAPVILVAPLLSKERSRALAIFAGVFVTVFAVLLPWTQVHRLAAALLAAGLGTAVARLLSSERRSRAVQRFGLLMAGAHVVGAIVVAGVRTWNTRSAYAALPPAPADAPSVLLIILDTVRASALSLYGYSRATSPNIDAFAAGGTVFDRAISTSPWTLPAHASIFTGRYPGNLTASFRIPLDGTATTLAETLRDAGYETVGFTGNLHYSAWDSGLDRGFLRYADYQRSVKQVLRSGWIGQTVAVLQLLDARKLWQFGEVVRNPKILVRPKPGGHSRNATNLADAVLDWSSQRYARPYFAFVNFFDAHEDYRPPDSLRTRFAANPKPRDLHDAEIYYIDLELGRMLRELERGGALENTMVIITADHGEHFGEHNLSGHGNSLYRQLLGVPFVFRFDGRIPAGRRVSQVVSLRDLPATITDLAGLSDRAQLPGRSLVTMWAGDSVSRGERSPSISELTQDALPLEGDSLRRSQFVSLIDDEHHFVRRNKRGVEEVYDTQHDPEELRNLINTPEGQAAATRSRERLRALLTSDLAKPDR